MLLTMLIAISSSFAASALSNCQCDTPVASVTFEAINRSSGTGKVRITNIADEDICFELGHGPRAFRLVRDGRRVQSTAQIPFVSLRDHCQVISPGDWHEETFDLGQTFPALLPRDELCFDARVKLKSEEDGSNTVISRCEVLR